MQLLEVTALPLTFRLSATASLRLLCRHSVPGELEAPAALVGAEEPLPSPWAASSLLLREAEVGAMVTAISAAVRLLEAMLVLQERMLRTGHLGTTRLEVEAAHKPAAVAQPLAAAAFSPQLLRVAVGLLHWLAEVAAMGLLTYHPMVLLVWLHRAGHPVAWEELAFGMAEGAGVDTLVEGAGPLSMVAVVVEGQAISTPPWPPSAEW